MKIFVPVMRKKIPKERNGGRMARHYGAMPGGGKEAVAREGFLTDGKRGGNACAPAAGSAAGGSADVGRTGSGQERAERSVSPLEGSAGLPCALCGRADREEGMLERRGCGFVRLRPCHAGMRPPPLRGFARGASRRGSIRM